MKRLFAFFLCLLLMAAAACGTAEEKEAAEGYIGMMEVINCNEWVSMRERASDSSPRLIQVPLGAVVQDARIHNQKWIHAAYEGFEGYILAEYLTPCKAEAAAPEGGVQAVGVQAAAIQPTAAPIRPGAVAVAVVTAEEGATLYSDTTGGTRTGEKLPYGVVCRNCLMQDNGVMYLEYNGRCLYADGSSLTPYPSLSSLENLPSPLLLATNLTPGGSVLSAPPVSVGWADGKLEISTVGEATQFRLWELTAADGGSEGYTLYKAKELILLEELSPSETLRVAVELGDTVPAVAIGYLDGMQMARLFLVELSGADGSVQMQEI